MTKAAEELFSKLSKLPDRRQDELAATFLAELEDELKWDTSFSSSQNLLEKMANEALAEFQDGRTEPLMENGEFTKN